MWFNDQCYLSLNEIHIISLAKIGDPDIKMNNVNDLSSVNAVSLKLPEFWPDQALVWFTQAESQFTLRGVVAEQTRFHYVTSALPSHIATRIIDLHANSLLRTHTPPLNSACCRLTLLSTTSMLRPF